MYLYVHTPIGTYLWNGWVDFNVPLWSVRCSNPVNQMWVIHPGQKRRGNASHMRRCAYIFLRRKSAASTVFGGLWLFVNGWLMAVCGQRLTVSG